MDYDVLESSPEDQSSIFSKDTLVADNSAIPSAFQQINPDHFGASVNKMN